MNSGKKNRPHKEDEVSAVDELRHEIQSGSDNGGIETGDGEEFLQLFASLSDEDKDLLPLPEIDQVLSAGEGLELSGRKRMLAAASRGLSYRRRSSWPLQAYLEQIRADLKVSAAELAIELKMDEAQLLRLERGETPLRSLEPSLIARWISKLHADLSSSTKALRRSLDLGKPSLSYSERDERSSEEKQRKIDEFITQVEDEVSKLQGCSE